MISKKDFKRINNYLWEVPKSFRSDMRVPARVYASEKGLEDIFRDRSIEQLINGTTMPGIVKYALAMPDCHQGYAVPIGFVGAVSIKEGVVSPGACGFDINCLAPGSKVLLNNGSYIAIKELEKEWPFKKVKVVDVARDRTIPARVLAFLKKYNNPTIYKISTLGKNKIELSGDHPVLTKQGMKQAELLREGEYVLVHPFTGVAFQKPADKIVLSTADILKTLASLNISNKGSAVSQIIKHLEKRSLSPLKLNSSLLAVILKLMGFILGDGALYFVDGRKGVIQFYGELTDLELIKKDLLKIGFRASGVYSRLRKHNIKTYYGRSLFARTEYSIRVNSTALAVALVALGVPFGNKAHQAYGVPKWIFGCPLWQKRLFLASFFGAEMSTPSTLNKYNFYSPQVNMQKKEGLEKGARTFLGDIANLLKEFDVEASEVRGVPGYQYTGKQGKTVGFRLQIKENAENMIKLFERIGYEYNLKKQREACLATHYLKVKLNIVAKRSAARRQIRVLYRQKGDFKKAAVQLMSKYVPEQFLYHSLFEEDSWGVRKKRGQPRIAFDFPSFGEYKKLYAYGKRGLVWDKIEKIEKKPYEGFVYDFTVADKNHNFIANNLVVSNCGMRLLKSEYSEKEIKPHLDKIAFEIQREVPSGLGKGRKVKLSLEQIDRILEGGAQYLVERGYGEKADVENCEAGGRLDWADAAAVSQHAKQRGNDQVGTLGSGNHFLEVQRVDKVFDEKTAKEFGLFKGQAVVMVHSGSRGLGHQVCTDYLKIMIPSMRRYGIKMPDREFACCPFGSKEGKRYFAAMAAAANYAWANRQMMAHSVRQAWQRVLGEQAGLTLIYDVAHNIIKKEKYQIEGKKVDMAVHRKGATRAFPPNHPELSKKYRQTGQPVLIPGSMGTASYVLVGTEKAEESFFSTSHGAGRTMSRKAATRAISGQEVVRELEQKGIVVKCHSPRGIAEEAPLAYKDIDSVVEVVDRAGLSKKVARLVPLAVIKGE